MIQNDPENLVRDEQLEEIQEVAINEELTEEIEKTEADLLSAEEEFINESVEEALSTPEILEEDDNEVASDIVSDIDIVAEEAEIIADLPLVDYSGYSKNDLIETLTLLVENRYPAEIKNDVDRIKALFYKKIKQEAEDRKNEFLEGGGTIEEYRPWVDPDEARFKLLLEKFKEKKNNHGKVQDAEKEENLKKKYDIIEKIKDLVNREESINKTFNDFRSLQNEWYNIGVVPQTALKNLWENYHHSVELFYSYIKINKELKDLDLKKNSELKTQLCERAEALFNEQNAVSAFRTLQEYHNEWREIGPTLPEVKELLWERFKEATAQVNKRHHEYFENQKEEQKKNLESKIALCVAAEEIGKTDIISFKDFDSKSAKIVELQKKWRALGFAPKKHNNKIYKRFKDACDVFFEKRRQFYALNKDSQLKNLQMKIDLCIRAEALKDSTDWKSTVDTLIKLQKEWKEIGPTPRKHSEKCWKRFRKACDYFFDRKTAFFSELDNSYENNLKLKLEIIEELEKLSSESNTQTVIERLKELQKKWNEIGFVPFDKKEKITNRYKKTLNNQLSKLKHVEDVKSILEYENKLESIKNNPNALRKLRAEREKFVIKIKQLESEIVVLENNISFFAKSAKADTMIKTVEEKIDNAKKLMKTLEEKVKIIDMSGLDD